MSFLKNVQTKYHSVNASHGVIKTSEPIKIKWEYEDDMLVIKVDGIDYAVIENVPSMDDVDLNAVQQYVEDTYYDGDYKSNMYSPARMKFKKFSK